MTGEEALKRAAGARIASGMACGGNTGAALLDTYVADLLLAVRREALEEAADAIQSHGDTPYDRDVNYDCAAAIRSLIAKERGDAPSHTVARTRCVACHDERDVPPGTGMGSGIATLGDAACEHCGGRLTLVSRRVTP